jgi:anti-sigma factor RsiW
LTEEEALELYLDGEMEPLERRKFEELLQRSPQLQDRLNSLRTLGQRLRGLSTTLPAGLEERVLTPKPRRRNYAVLLSLVAVLALFYAAGVGAKPPGGFSQADVKPMVADHLEAMPEKGTLTTADPERLASWLEPQVDFRPEIPRWPWAQLVSGRLCWIRSRKLARIRYRSHEREFSVFIFPDSDSQSAQAQSVRDLQACYWAGGGLGYVVVMPVDLARQHPLQAH